MLDTIIVDGGLKMNKLLLLIGICFSTVGYAESPFPGDCTGGNYAPVEKSMSDALKNNLASLAAKRAIKFDLSTLILPVSAGPTNDDNNPKIIYLLFRLFEASVSSADGTPFDLYFDGGQEEFANYVEIPVSNGYDKEGNPINGHCTLKIRPNVGTDLPYNTSFVIRNHRSGQIIGTFPLPASFRLY
jgi:hypothetical protein